MSLPFSEDFSALGSFETDAIELLTRAFTTETFHYRVIVNLEDPFRTAVDVTVVTNRLGACLAFEDVQDAKSAVERFTDQFTFGSSGKIGPVNAFCTLALFRDGFQTENMNTDHPETRWCIDPRLLEKADAVFDDHSFFLIPLDFILQNRNESTGALKELVLSMRKNAVLSKLEVLPKYRDISAWLYEHYKGKNFDSPSIGFVATSAYGSKVDVFPRVYIHAKEICQDEYFPVLYGINSSWGGNYLYICYYDQRPNNKKETIGDRQTKADIIDDAIERAGFRHLFPDKKFRITWDSLALGMALFDKGYEAGHEAATRSRKADELAGD